MTQHDTDRELHSSRTLEMRAVSFSVGGELDVAV